MAEVALSMAAAVVGQDCGGPGTDPSHLCSCVAAPPLLLLPREMWVLLLLVGMLGALVLWVLFELAGSLVGA